MFPSIPTHPISFYSCLVHILIVPTSLAEPIFVGTLFAPTWSMKTKPRGNNSWRILRRLNLINLGEVALSWKQIWGVPFLVINWFPLWLYYRTASGDSAHCYHIYPFLVVNGLNAQVQSCAWSLLFFFIWYHHVFCLTSKKIFCTTSLRVKNHGFLFDCSVPNFSWVLLFSI